MMRQRISAWVAAAHRWRLYERGVSSIAIFLLGFPTLIMAFGFGLDVIRAGYAKRIAQGRLDVSVQAAASMTYTTNNGEVRFGQVGDGTTARSSIDEAQRLYGVNTAQYRRSGANSNGLFSCPEAQVKQGAGQSPVAVSSTQCSGGAWRVGPTAPGPTYDFCSSPADGGYGIKYEVLEQVPTVFMRMVPGGPTHINLQLDSIAYVRQQFC